MATYNIQIKKSAQKELKELQESERHRVITKIQSLAHTPRGPHCKKLSAQERYRIRVGVYRILYEIHDDTFTVMIVNIAHRKEVYR